MKNSTTAAVNETISLVGLAAFLVAFVALFVYELAEYTTLLG
jgi:hypothetical protein